MIEVACENLQPTNPTLLLKTMYIFHLRHFSIVFKNIITIQHISDY